MSGPSVVCSPSNASVVNYTRPLLEIEKSFDNCGAFTWMRSNWRLCYYFMGAYLVAIFVGRRAMRFRPPFQLRIALFFWNVVLAVYSIVSTWRVLPALLYTLQLQGFSASFCSLGQEEQIQAVGVWLFLNTLSKVVEFGDTAFIVLRKAPLTFLHWYHHLSVTFYTSSACAHPSPMHNYFLVVNLVVHSIMYSYYALKMLGTRVPRLVSMAITALQMLQMVAGMLVTWYAHRRKAADQSCNVDEKDIVIAGSIYFTYLLLFFNFFVKRYVLAGKKPTASNGDAKKIS